MRNEREELIFCAIALLGRDPGFLLGSEQSPVLFLGRQEVVSFVLQSPERRSFAVRQAKYEQADTDADDKDNRCPSSAGRILKSGRGLIVNQRGTYCDQ